MKKLKEKSKRNKFSGGTINKKNSHRKKYLADSLKCQFKTNIFSDQRIGEKNPSLDKNKKLIKRLAAQKNKEFKKQNLYSLDDDDDEMFPVEEPSMAAYFSDDEDDDNSGNIGGDIVKSVHFGGGMFAQTNDKNSEKSKNDFIDRMISESRKKRMESQQEKSQQEDLVKKLDDQRDLFIRINQPFLLTPEEKDESKKNCEFVSYDHLIRELTIDMSGRARPRDKLKTPEELKEEARIQLIQHEKELLERMNLNEEKEIDDDIRNPEEIEVQERDRKKKQSLDTESLNEIIEVNKKRKRGKKEKQIKETSEKVIEAKSEKVIEAESLNIIPEEYSDFLKIFRGFSPEKFSSVISSMISKNHPTTGTSSDVCARLFAFLLQTINKICTQKDGFGNKSFSRYDYINSIIPHLLPLARLFPARSANIVNEIIDGKIDEYFKQEKKTYPSMDTFVILTIAGLIYPPSDYVHDVMTRVTTFMLTILGQCEIHTRRDITAALYTTHLFCEYLSISKRFAAEITNTLHIILSLAVDSSLANIKTMSMVDYTENLLKLSGKKLNVKEIPKIKLMWLNNDSLEITEKFKIIAIYNCLKILSKIINIWKDLPSWSELFKPFEELLNSLHVSPKSLKQCKENIITVLSQKPILLPLIKKQRVRPMRTLEPKFDEGKTFIQKNKQLTQKVRRDRKSARRNVAKSQRYINQIKLSETLAKDEANRKKLNIIYNELGLQESSYQQLQKPKKRIY